MDAVSIATSLIAARQDASRTATSMAILKKSADAEQAMAGLLAAAVEGGKSAAAAPPPGMGAVVDVTA